MSNFVIEPGGASVPEQVAYNYAVGSAAFATSQVTVTNSATLIAAARTGQPGTGRIAITIENLGTNIVYIGGSGVTTSTGMAIQGIAGTNLSFATTAAVYGITASASQAVSVLETF